MDIRGYWRILRQRWTVVVAVGAIGLLSALIVSFLANDGRTPYTGGSGYTASTTLLLLSGSPTSTAATSAVVTSPRVAADAAARLGTPENPADLVDHVTTLPAEPDRTIVVSATGPDPARAAALANAFGAATVDDMRNRTRDAARAEQVRLRDRLGALNEQLAANDPDTAAGAAERPALTEQYTATFRALQEIGDPDRLATPTDVIDVLIPADPATATGNPFVPSSTLGRAAVGTVLGLLVGGALALLLERLNARPLNRLDMQRAHRLPVLAEIPRFARRRATQYAIATEADPGGAVADGYRSLLSALFLVPRAREEAGAISDNGASRQAPQAILVASARPAEAKTSTVVNLATCIARTGRTVLVVDFDVRGADAHLYLGTSSRAGVRDFVHDDDVVLSELIQSTCVPGVMMIAAGRPEHRPYPPRRAAELVRHARAVADVVLLDSPPMLLGNTAIDLVAHVDAVLVSTFVGRTTEADAERVSELLARTGAPVVGLAVSGASGPTGSDWLRYLHPRRTGSKDAPPLPGDVSPGSAVQ